MNQPISHRSFVLSVLSMSACLVLAGAVAGCGKQQDASREQGKAAAEAIKAPIDRARQVDVQQQQAAEEARKKMDAQTQ